MTHTEVLHFYIVILSLSLLKAKDPRPQPANSYVVLGG